MTNKTYLPTEEEWRMIEEKHSWFRQTDTAKRLSEMLKIGRNEAK